MTLQETVYKISDEEEFWVTAHMPPSGGVFTHLLRDKRNTFSKRFRKNSPRHGMVHLSKTGMISTGASAIIVCSPCRIWPV